MTDALIAVGLVLLSFVPVGLLILWAKFAGCQHDGMDGNEFCLICGELLDETINERDWQ